MFGGGRSAQLHNFESLSLYEGNRVKRQKSWASDKGHAEEMRVFVGAVKAGSAMPITLDCLLETTYLTLAAAESLRRGQVVRLDEFMAEAAVGLDAGRTPPGG